MSARAIVRGPLEVARGACGSHGSLAEAAGGGAGESDAETGISGYLVPVAATETFETTQRQRRALTDVSATYVTYLHMSH